MRVHPVLAVLLGLALAGCATSPPSSTSAADTFCTVYRATNDTVDTAYAQITQTASAQTVQSALDTIVAQLKTAVDASPPEAIKSDLQTMHTATAEARDQLAAVGYNLAQLPGGPPAVNNPEFETSARKVLQWGQTHCR